RSAGSPRPPRTPRRGRRTAGPARWSGRDRPPRGAPLDRTRKTLGLSNQTEGPRPQAQRYEKPGDYLERVAEEERYHAELYRAHRIAQVDRELGHPSGQARRRPGRQRQREPRHAPGPREPALLTPRPQGLAGDHPGHERRGREGQQVPARRTEQVHEPREAPVEDRDPHDARG